MKVGADVQPDTVETAPTVFEMQNITKLFGDFAANEDITLKLQQGEIVALLGENGAGKSTLMNVLLGHYVADSGQVLVDQGQGLQPIPVGSTQAALNAGIGMVHQHFTLAENLSAFENIILGTEPIFRLTTHRKIAREKVEQLVQSSGLDVALDDLVFALTVAEKQRVEILKALYRDIRILVLDEPTAVLTPQESTGLFDILTKLARRGLAVVFISHKLHEVLAVSQRIVVLRSGKLVANLPTQEASLKQLATLMVGFEIPKNQSTPQTPGAVLLELDGIDVHNADSRRALHQVSFKLHSGEILGIAGVAGNGQTALAELVSGLIKPDSGQILFEQQVIKAYSAKKFIKLGIGRIPEDRHQNGIIGAMSVAENLVLESFYQPQFQKFGFLRFNQFQQQALKDIQAYDIKCSGPNMPSQLMSGGNIQKLILARVLNQKPKVIVANQPTRGLDVGAQHEIYKKLLSACEQQSGILLISEDLDELFTLADHVLVIHNGRLQYAGPTENLDRGTVGLMMAGGQGRATIQ